MNSLQEKPTTASFEPPTAATRPFTRVLNLFCDQIKPAMRKHKVDRSVLDAIVRQLEGFHRSSVTLTIHELATKAGVSNSSVSGALARLEAQGLIIRRRKLLRERSRFIWELSLTREYRVVEASESPRALEPRLGRQAPPAAAPPEPSTSSIQPINSPPEPLAAAPAPASIPSPPDRTPPASPSSDTPPPSGRHRQKVHKPEVADKPRRKPPELTTEQRQLVERLRSASIDYWMACKLARAHSASVIDQVLANLRHRAGTIRNPAAWLVREIERGGYDSPVAQEEQKKAERVARELEQKQRDARERELVEQATARLLETFRRLPLDHQSLLEQRARDELRRVSPRLAEAPWDLEQPGPIRSKLLELLEVLPRADNP